MSNEEKVYHALVVDDDPDIRRVVTRALKAVGFSCDSASDGEFARQKLNLTKTDLLVTDLRMPVRHGHRLIVDVFGRIAPPMVVVITGLVEPAIASDLVMRGVADLVLKPFDPIVLAAKWKAMLRYRDSHGGGVPRVVGSANTPSPVTEAMDQESVARQLSEASDALRSHLKEITSSFEETIQDLERKQETLSAGLLGSVRLLTQLMRQFDSGESSHPARVERLAEGICDRVTIDRDELRNIRLASLLHDLGQFGMPDSVRITPPEQMSASQLEAYRRYPEIGATLLSEVPGCVSAVELIVAHAEWFNGTGFPKRLRGTDIPLGARIIRLADGVDTFLMYHSGKERETALAAHLVAERGIVYDPDILDASFEFLVESLKRANKVTCTVHELEIGDILEADLISPQGHIIARRGATVNETMKTYVQRIMGDTKITVQRSE